MKKVHLIGNAHLDPVWLWRWQEGFAEIKATFKSALDRMNEFADYKFTSACSAYYMWIEKSDKKMFDEIVQRVKEGRWNIVGGQFIQPDCNIPCGESFARHSLVSQRYFKEKFGITAETGYNVDSFGHNASIPKIMVNSGMKNYVFMRPMPDEKQLEQSLFKWESMDGSRVNAYRIPFFYNIDVSRFEVFEEIANMDENYDKMAFYGIGNHGGGATVELLDRMQRELDERYVYSTPDEYFKTVEDLQLPILKDDLQFHATGCYSACSQVKKGNRMAENSALTTERYSVLSNKLIGTEYPSEELRRAWENILFNQFHDILGGCTIREACEDANYSHSESVSICEKASNFALQQISWNIDTMDGKEIKSYKPAGTVWKSEENIGTPVVVFNSSCVPVTAAVFVRAVPTRMTDDKGNKIPHQMVRDSKTNGSKDKYGAVFTAEVPALGYRVYRMYFEDIPDDKGISNEFICTESSMENNKIKVSFNTKSGELESFFDKLNNTELLSGDTRTVFVDETHCDTWAHGIKEFKNVITSDQTGTVKLIENGPVRATIRSEVKAFNTVIIRDYSLEANSNTLTVRTKIDFHEKHKMLKFTLPVNTKNPRVYAKIPFGFIEKPADGAERPCGEWIAMHGTDCGIGIANDSKYAFDADNNELSLTILRGAIYADHNGERDEFCEYMEQGIHRFEYSVFPFESKSDAEHKSYSLNNKLVTVAETFHKGNLPTEYSGIKVSEENIIITALKKHEDSDALILRCYEAEDKDTDVKIELFGTEFFAHLSHSQVKTFLIKDNKAEEVNFIEWK